MFVKIYYTVPYELSWTHLDFVMLLQYGGELNIITKKKNQNPFKPIFAQKNFACGAYSGRVTITLKNYGVEYESVSNSTWKCLRAGAGSSTKVSSIFGCPYGMRIASDNLWNIAVIDRAPKGQ